jgi:hypothetical protein
MNKVMKMVSAAVLPVSLIASLSGCGSVTAQSLAEKLSESMADVQSLQESVTMDFEGSVTMTSYNVSTDMILQVSQDSEITVDPLVTHSNGTLSMTFMDESDSMDYENYSVLDEDTMTIYESSDGGSWIQYTEQLDTDQLAAVSSLYNESLMQGIADGSVEAELQEETQTFHDEECYVVTSAVSGDQLMSLLEQTGLNNTVTQYLSEEDLADTSTPVTIYFSKESQRLAGMSIDMKELGQTMFDSLMEGQGIDDYEVEMDTFQVEIALSDYNTIDTIEIPQEAQDAEEYTDSGLFTYSEDVQETPAATSTPTATASASAASTTDTGSQTAGSTDWTTFAFNLDGTDYVLPFAYQDIASIWSFDMADYGYPDGYTTNPGDQQAATITVTNSQYDMDFQIGLVNMSDTTEDITQNNIWAVNMSIEWADSWPSLTLPGGITWGSSLDEITAAYGQPTEDPYYSESLQYYSLTYRTDDYNRYMRLTVYDNGGLMAVSLEDYDLN